jgi:hypothetical protein
MKPPPDISRPESGRTALSISSRKLFVLSQFTAIRHAVGDHGAPALVDDQDAGRDAIDHLVQRDLGVFAVGEFPVDADRAREVGHQAIRGRQLSVRDLGAVLAAVDGDAGREHGLLRRRDVHDRRFRSETLGQQEFLEHGRRRGVAVLAHAHEAFADLLPNSPDPGREFCRLVVEDARELLSQSYPEHGRRNRCPGRLDGEPDRRASEEIGQPSRDVAPRLPVDGGAVDQRNEFQDTPVVVHSCTASCPRAIRPPLDSSSGMRTAGLLRPTSREKRL